MPNLQTTICQEILAGIHSRYFEEDSESKARSFIGAKKSESYIRHEILPLPFLLIVEIRYVMA